MDRGEDPKYVWALRAGFALLVLVVWDLAARRLGENFFASPLRIGERAVHIVQNGELVLYGLPTLGVLLTGFALAVVLGVPAGLAVGRWRRLYALSEGPINLAYSTPLAAVIPVLLVIMGFGAPTKVFIVFMFTVFPVVINSAAGVRTVEGDLIELARSFRSSEWPLWREILIPNAMPFMLTGIRIGIGRALIGAVVADFYAGISGVGYLIILCSNRFDVATALVPVILLAALGVGSTVLLKRVQRKVTPWAGETAV